MNLQPELSPTSISGDLRRGGWLVQGRVEGDTDAVSQGLNWIIDGKSLASFADSSWRTALDIHVLADPDFQYARHGSVATFQAGTSDRFLVGESVQDISFAAVGSPANSHEATSWNFGEIVSHLLESHTNYIYDATGNNGSPNGWITDTDIDETNSTDVEVFKVDKSDNLWRTIQQIGGGEEGGGEFYRPYFNRKNKFIYQPAPPFLSPLPAARLTIDKEYIRGRAQVRFNNNQPGERVGQVEIKAVWPQFTITASSLFDASYPSNPATGKIFRKTSGIFADSQSRANTLAERLYRWLTRSYTITVEVDPGLVLFGDDGNGLDLGDRVLLTYDGPTEDADTGAGVHLNLSAQSMFVYGIDIRPDTNNKRATATVTLEQDNSA